MKKYLVFVFVFSLFCLSACSSTPSPSEVVDSYMSAIKSQDADLLSQVYNGDISDMDFANTSKLETDAYSEAFSEALLSKFLSFEYEILNEKITENSAVVKVKIQTYDFATIFTESIRAYISQAFSLLLSDVSEDELTAVMEKILMEKMESAPFDYEETVPLKLTKSDDNVWRIREIKDDTEFMNALTGGLMQYANDLKSKIEDLEE